MGNFYTGKIFVFAESNDISSNKCGGIRVGMNYSASVIIDGNTIKNHSGPDILAFNDEISYHAEATDLDEAKVYSTPPLKTDRNLSLCNNKPIQSPRDTVKSKKTCCGCQKMSTSFKACTNCRIARYCSKECQTNHWILHKHMCPLLSEKYTIEIRTTDTQPRVPEIKPGCHVVNTRHFHPSLIGIFEGPPPDVKSTKRFIVKIQSDHDYLPYNPKKYLTLYDQSVTLDIQLINPELSHQCSECGRLSGDKITSKKIFCWAS
ncbi:unnamed protein product [Mytilus coruscus]|uniref:MYND-type domain-containing protein n=1 Tax=Mytilus coruscus TaxID=42192 RepID=A0A6J8BS93_MYTCO|nr:unnamed protein product [Mytilus coruscus]